MAFYTKPTNLQKDQDNIASLDKSQLLLESKVSSDPYYSDSSNWNYVVVTYKSVGGNQLSNVIFDASLENPTGSFYISEKAKDIWEVQSVRIDDFDGGFLSFSRSELNVSDFDISFVPEPVATGGVNIGIGSLINAGIEFEQNGNGVVGTSVSINQTPSIVLPGYTYIGS